MTKNQRFSIGLLFASFQEKNLPLCVNGKECVFFPLKNFLLSCEIKCIFFFFSFCFALKIAMTLQNSFYSRVVIVYQHPSHNSIYLNLCVVLYFLYVSILFLVSSIAFHHLMLSRLRFKCKDINSLPIYFFFQQFCMFLVKPSFT